MAFYYNSKNNSKNNFTFVETIIQLKVRATLIMYTCSSGSEKHHIHQNDHIHG